MTAAETERSDPPVDVRILDLYDRLSATERRLADTVLACQGDLASYSATELAGRAGVSKATAARFFRRLGYRDFTEARLQARSQRGWGSPLFQLAGVSDPARKAGNFGLHLTQDLQNITRTLEGLRSDAVGEAIDRLSQAPHLWVAGFRNSYALAHYARGLLIQVKPDVRLLPVGGQSLAEDLASVEPGDALLLIAFRRRPVLLRDLVAATQRAGATTILITDPSAAVTANLAPVVLRCHNRGIALFDSYAAAVSLLTFLCAAVGLRLGRESADRLERIESLHRDLDALVPTAGDEGPDP